MKKSAAKLINKKIYLTFCYGCFCGVYSTLGKAKEVKKRFRSVDIFTVEIDPADPPHHFPKKK